MSSMFIRNSAVLLSTAIVMILVGGCNVLSAVSFVVHPEPEVEAMHTLRDVPTVVFIDDRSNRISPVRLRRIIAEEATTVLMEEDLISEHNMISSRDATMVSTRHDRSGKLLSMNAIGEATGASQLIYVFVEEFALTRDGYNPEPRCICRVRVLDIKEKKRSFPPPEDPSSYGYYRLDVEMKKVDPHQFQTISMRNILSEELAVETGDRIAKIFYTYMTPELGDRITPPR